MIEIFILILLIIESHLKFLYNILILNLVFFLIKINENFTNLLLKKHWLLIMAYFLFYKKLFYFH